MCTFSFEVVLSLILDVWGILRYDIPQIVRSSFRILNPLGMHMFSWNGKESSLYTGIMLVFAGILVVFSSAVVKILSKRYVCTLLITLG